MLCRPWRKKGELNLLEQRSILREFQLLRCCGRLGRIVFESVVEEDAFTQSHVVLTEVRQGTSQRLVGVEVVRAPPGVAPRKLPGSDIPPPTLLREDFPHFGRVDVE